MSNREKFLATVREAARAGRAYRVHLNKLPENVGYQGAGPDVIAKMQAEINTVGGQAQVVESYEAAAQAVAALLEHYQPRSALCWQHPVLERLGLVKLLKDRAIAQLDYDALKVEDQPAQRGRMFAAEIGITSCTHAVAETGTLAMCSGPGSERLASLLPPVHIAVVHREQILPDLFDLFARLEADGLANLSSNVSLITGPSKTGDLELRLTTGVHGPGKWHVILIAG